MLLGGIYPDLQSSGNLNACHGRVHDRGHARGHVDGGDAACQQQMRC